MKKEFQIAYVPIGVPTFHLESAQKEFDKSVALIKSLTDPASFQRRCSYPLTFWMHFWKSANRIS